jgi:hypothetical protein
LTSLRSALNFRASGYTFDPATRLYIVPRGFHGGRNGSIPMRTVRPITLIRRVGSRSSSLMGQNTRPLVRFNPKIL